MIKIKTISSGSHGNCYQLDDDRTKILIECGISIKRIKKALGFRLSRVSGCLCTHSHADHSKSVKDVMRSGINCFMSGGCANALRLTGHRLKIIEAGKQFRVGSWTVLPFDTVHDAANSVGFLLASGENRVLFLTDSAYVNPRFAGLTHILIETNYCPDILDDNIKKGVIPASMKERLLFTHMSLDNTLEFLKANDLTRVREIHLIHISKVSGDPERMKREVQALTGKQVFIAQQ